MYKVEFLKGALEDYINIGQYIALDNLFYSNQVLNKIQSSIDLLEIFPFIWKIRKEWIREIVEPQYKFRIFYKIEQNTIYIVSIFKYKDNWM